MKYTVKVEVDVLPDKSNVFVSYDGGGEQLSFRQMSHILVGGISLIVKLIDKSGEMKDYELMEEIINHLNQEFASLKSFNDAEIIKEQEND